MVIDKQRKLHKDIMVSDTKLLTEQIREFVNKEAVIGH